MAKGSGTYRTSNPKSNVWDGSDDDVSIAKANTRIFKAEAKAGLGSYELRKPQYVSSSEYDAMLASGDYVEIYHAGTHANNDQMLNGKYHVSDEVHIYGKGYYFASDKQSVYLGTESRPDVVTALVRKSDVISRSEVSGDIESGIRRYVSKSVADSASAYDKKDVYGYTSAAARRGKKVFFGEGKMGHYVVIDRSALIVRR